MDYLYFDIECCDGNHMCSFGYVVADERFDIIEKDDILINPQMPFKLGRDNFDPYVKLAYTEAEFCRHAPFDGVYGKIRALLTARDRRLFGHSVASDMKYLDIACKRYNLPPFDIAAYDTQKIYARSVGDKNMSSLESIMDKLAVDTTHLSAHKSCDDAEMTMLVVKTLCARAGCDAAALTAAHGNCVVDREKLAIAELNTEIKKTVARLKRAYAESRGWEKIKLSDELKLLHADRLERLVECVYAAGYAFTPNGEKFDYFVADNAAAIDGELPQSVKVIGFDEFLGLIKAHLTPDGRIVSDYSDCEPNSLKRFFERAAAAAQTKKTRKNKGR